jgi:hypothetical protein
MLDAHFRDGSTRRRRLLELSRGNAGECAGKLNDCPDERFVQAQTCHRTDDALTADGRGFDSLAIFQEYEQGDHPGKGKVDLRDLVMSFEQRYALSYGHENEMGFQTIKVVNRQRCQQFVGHRTRSLDLQVTILPGRSGPFPAVIDVAFRDDASTDCLFFKMFRATLRPVPVTRGRSESVSWIKIGAALFGRRSPTLGLALSPGARPSKGPHQPAVGALCALFVG